jgi:hypothetical protein
VAWTRKSTAPAYVNGGEAFTALITGDGTWGWLLGWVPIIGNPLIDVNALCAAGPPTVTPIALTDFLPDHPRNWWEQIGSDVRTVAKLRSLMYDRLFSAYCESVTPSGSYFDRFNDTVCTPSGGNWGLFVQPIPAGATHGHAIFTAADPPGAGNIWQYRMVLWSDAVGGGRVDIGSGLPGTGATGWDSGVFSTAGSAYFTIMLISSTDVTTHVQCAHVQLMFDAGGTETHTATPQPAPTGLPPRTAVTAADLTSMAAELDNLEFKLDHVVALIGFLTSATALPPEFADAPVPAVADTPLDVTGAAGILVTVSGIPAGADEQFGTPPKYHRLGRVTLGTADGWLPSFDLEHNPLVIMPIPAGVTRAQVSVSSPITATVTVLRPGK